MSLIKKEVTVTINNDKASLDEEIYLYQNDRNIDIYITIKDVKYSFEDVLTRSSASFSRIKVLKPNGDKFITDKLPITDNKILLTITKAFTDQIEEIGVHKFQIQLFDSQQGRLTVPPLHFTVLAPLFEDDDKDDNIVTISCEREDD